MTKLGVIYLVLVLYFQCFNCKPDAFKFVVWGPGLDVKIHLPVRYFWVQAVNNQGKNITASLGDNALDLHIMNNHNSQLRIHKEVLDRHDGSYLIRIKPHHTYHDLSIIIRYKGDLVGNSPYYLKGPVYDEQCDCGLDDLDEFMRVYGCPEEYQQITSDFRHFNNIDMKVAWEDMSVRFDKPRQMSVVHYVVKDNQLYRESLGEYVGFKMFSDELLLSLMRKVNLPDLDFVWNLGDWPLARQASLPLISWCGSGETYDLVVPTYDLTSSTVGAMDKTNKDMLMFQHYRSSDWSKKKKMAFWRGRDSSQERLDLVKLTQTHPDLIDAQLTHIFFFPKDNLTTHPGVPFKSFFDYTYQINMDGTVAAYRFPYLLSGGSLVFKQQSNYYEHFYRDLVPYGHYIPINRNISDLVEKLLWAKEHDEEAQRIANNAFDFTHNNLLPRDIYCYHAVFFKTYAERLRSRVDVGEKMEHVERSSDCDCVGDAGRSDL